ncbi:Eco57I restriction-modification methylase domain-containing protein [Halosolutus halophilus]|uniref:Eco57I restriction-modification methylase domain-containing protein n=1 Tax=Halosolutus halophilus TaxID=1552990 RepID=UPI002234EFF9|nr:type II restriction endonuclease subunit M [Halosolutus halophilus]
MTQQRITAADVRGWTSLRDIADALAKRGLEFRSTPGERTRLGCHVADEFFGLVEAGPGESPSECGPERRGRRTHLVATHDFESFTFVTRDRRRADQQHGRITYRTLTFTKEQFGRECAETDAILERLNAIEDDSSTGTGVAEALFDTRAVVEAFARQFEALRTDLVQAVAGIPDDRGDAKRRYVQVVLDRLLFLSFLQAKGLLDGDERYLHERPATVVDEGDDRYEAFYRPLCFDYLATDDQDPAFGTLPHLDGGLFAESPVEREFDDAKLGETPAETNALFDDVLAFLSDWEWDVDERLAVAGPKTLSPAILGHIYEQTVTQKDLGAYYTPTEITGFMARRTIHPSLVDRLNETVEADYESIDDVFGFTGDGASDADPIADSGATTPPVPIETVTPAHVETLYHDVLMDTRVLDPAVGSGAFLLAAQEVLLDVSVQCLEFFRRLDREGRGRDLDARTRDELAAIESGAGSVSLYAKRAIVRNALYGVDVDDGAVEICKRRLWLSMVADIEGDPGDVEPLPDVDASIRQGNSLVGVTDLVDDRDGGAPLTIDGGEAGESARDTVAAPVEDEAIDRAETTEGDESARREAAARRLFSSREEFDDRVLADFHDAGIEDFTRDDLADHSPFHWPLEFPAVYAEGGFDVVIGNPPWDVVAPNREEYFTTFDELFRTRPPSEKDAVQERLLADPSIAAGWEAYQEKMATRAAYFNGSSQYVLQNPDVGGSAVGNENDLSMLFLERVFEVANDESYVAQILPGTVFVGAAGADLRTHLLDATTLQQVVLYENRGIFPDVDTRYKFGIAVCKNSGRTERFETIYRSGDLDVLGRIDESAVTVPREVLTEYSPSTGLFPLLESAAQVAVLRTLVDHPPLGDDSQGWTVTPYRELDRNQDRDRYVESEAEGEYPVYGGSNVYQYSYSPDVVEDLDAPTLWSVGEDRDPERSAKRRIREKAFRSRDPEMGLKKAIYEAFDGTGSQKAFVNDLLERERGKPLSPDDVKLDCSAYRIVFRNITNSTNERTMICAVVPKGVVCHHALNTIRPYTFDIDRSDLSDDPLHSVYERVFTDRELFAALGLLNSLPFDYLMRTKIEENLVMYKLTESQVPRLTAGDDWFEYISTRAARLNCYGAAFAEMRDRLGGIDPVTDAETRTELQAEIDAAACHAYGLTRRDAAFVRDSFHRVSSPRIMTDAYFELVGTKYDRLESADPVP